MLIGYFLCALGMSNHLAVRVRYRSVRTVVWEVAAFYNGLVGLASREHTGYASFFTMQRGKVKIFSFRNIYDSKV